MCPELLDKKCLKKIKHAGFTSLQSYVTWAALEPRPNEICFSLYDPLVERISEVGLKWVPFLVLGPYYATPEWFRRSKESVYFRCLEHGKEVPIQSIWNPYLRKYVRRFLHVFSSHYDHEMFESVLLGVSGNWGEALYPATGGFNPPPRMHSHVGWWCGDRFAIRSFRQWLKRKYRSIYRINEKWGTEYRTFEEIKYPSFLSNPIKWLFDKFRFSTMIFSSILRRTGWYKGFLSPITLKWRVPGNEQEKWRWLDFVGWYIQSMSDWAELWLKYARKYFPRNKLYLVVGGDGNPLLGADFGILAKIAARYKAGIRITNQGDEYPINFCLTRLVASACKFYGGYFSTEEALFSSPKGIVSRIFETVSSGATGIYFKNIFVSDVGWAPCGRIGEALRENFEAFIRNRKTLRSVRPVRRVALFFPKSEIWLQITSLWVFYERTAELRNFFDFDFLDECLIEDGALKNYGVLIVGLGRLQKNPAVEAWIKKGGVLIGTKSTIRSFSSFETGKGKVLIMPRWSTELCKHFVKKSLRWDPVILSEKKDGVYLTKVEDGVICYNSTSTGKWKSIGGRKVWIDPYSIAKIRC